MSWKPPPLDPPETLLVIVTSPPSGVVTAAVTGFSGVGPVPSGSLETVPPAVTVPDTVAV